MNMILLDILTFAIVAVAAWSVVNRYLKKGKKPPSCSDKGVCSKCNMCKPDEE